MKSSDVAFRRSGSDEVLSPENSSKPPWSWTQQMMIYTLVNHKPPWTSYHKHGKMWHTN